MTLTNGKADKRDFTLLLVFFHDFMKCIEASFSITQDLVEAGRVRDVQFEGALIQRCHNEPWQYDLIDVRELTGMVPVARYV